MLKFNVIAQPLIAAAIQNRVVEHVTEYRITNPIAGKVVMWRGATELEYFSIAFLRGILTISLSEREILLGEKTINYAMVSSLMEVIERGDTISTIEATYNYNAKQSFKDAEVISFTDVLVIFGWNYKQGVKIDYDMLMN